MESTKQFFAFISYKREDEAWAKWLQHKLEHYKLPANLNGRTDLPKEIRPVFKDTSELNPGNLPQQIHDALEQSKHLIVVCSPCSAQSEWVNKEVETFIGMGKTDCIIPFIIEGKAFAKNPEEECFPEAIRNLPSEQEILGANISEMGRDAAAVKVVAQMFGLRFDELWQRYEREQKKKRNRAILGIAILALVAFSVAGWIWRQNVLLKEKDWKMMENQSRFVAEKAQNLVEEGDLYTAQRLLLEVLPVDVSKPNRPCTPEAEKALRNACHTVGFSCLAIIKNSGVVDGTFSPDGKYIITASRNGSVNVWSIESGQLIHTFDGDVFGISPDGNIIVVHSGDFSLEVYEVVSGRHVKTLGKYDEIIEDISFSPNGKYVSITDHYQTRVLDVESERQIDSLDTSLDFCGPDCRWIVVPEYSSLKILDFESGETIRTLTGHSDRITRVAFSPDGKLIATASYDHTGKIWDSDSGEELKNFDMHGIVYSVAFSPNGRQIIFGSSDCTAKIWDVSTGNLLHTLEGHTRNVFKAAFSPDAKRVLTISSDETLRIWGIEQEAFSVEGHKQGANYAAYSPDGQQIVSASDDHTLKIWDAQSGRLIHELKGHDKEVNCAVFSHDGKRVVSASNDHTVKIWDVDNGTLLQTFEGHEDNVYCVVFSPDDKLIASGSEFQVLVWDVTSGQIVRTFGCFYQIVSSIAFSPDGKRIATASYDANVNLLDIETGEEVATFYAGSDYSPDFLCINSVAFSPDGRFILSAADDGYVQIWSEESEKSLVNLVHDDQVNFASYSPDGNFIVTASEDGVVRVWDIKLREVTVSQNWNNVPVNSAIYSPDGKKIVVALKDGSVRMWEFQPLQELIDQTRERFRDNPLTPEERHQYYLE